LLVKIAKAFEFENYYVPPGKALIWFLGHASFAIKTPHHPLIEGWWRFKKGVIIYVDPWLTNKVFSNPSLVRILPPAVTYDQVKKVDLLAHSHNHLWKVFDEETTIHIIRNTNATVITNQALAEDAKFKSLVPPERLKVLREGETVTFEDAAITATKALHNVPTIGFLINAAGVKIYHPGDTVPFPEMSELAGKVDVAMFHLAGLSGTMPDGSVRSTVMTVQEAAKCVGVIKPKVAIPMHYNTLEAIKADPNMFQKLALSESPTTAVHVMNPGDALIYP
jgi:L-ascorbate metabolism protein UlaG (beta-lactamase superfamily)